MEDAYEVVLILIAERDETVRELQTFFLNAAGFQVEFSDDGEAALARARQCVPEVVVTEILIPRLDGLALCRALHADPETANVPVIVLSVLAASGRARDAGAIAFLGKPIIESSFVATIQQAIAAQSSPGREPLWASK